MSPASQPRKITAISSKLLAWFASNARDLPWRRTRDPYAIWVSEIMLQQTQVKTVIPFWERWLRELPTIEAAAHARSGRLHKLWEGLGYYTRVCNLQKAAQMILRRHGGKFPEQFEDVRMLPGIGRYTAGAVCSIAFNQATPVLDGNVIRVLTRVFGIAENPKEKTTNERLWELAGKLVLQASRITDQGCSRLNQSLMELGALVCTPRNAQCWHCPLKALCVAFRENRVAALPNRPRPERATARRYAAFVIERDGKFLVRQRPAGVVNAHLWEFPNVRVPARRTTAKIKLPRAAGPREGAPAAWAKGIRGLAPDEIAPWVTVKHTITRYRITLEAFRINPTGLSLHGGTPGAREHGSVTGPTIWSSQIPMRGAVWKTPAQMRRLAFASAHRKILHALGTRTATSA